MRAWGITDGSTGMVSQVKALAELLKIPVDMKVITLPKPYVWLPNSFYASPFTKKMAAFLLQQKVQGVAPKFVISCGRKGAAVSMALKLLMPKTTFICLQDPRVSSEHFDLVVAMQHDKIIGSNVLKIRFALHQITSETLANAQEKFAVHFETYEKPRVAVLLGGSTNKYTLTQNSMQQVVAQMEQLLAQNTCSLFITPSRRTGEENIRLLDYRFRGNDRVYIYDGQSENPYFALLAASNFIVVTDDSVNMMSEAVATGKPMYILPLAGHKNTKPARFAEALIADGIARKLEDKLEFWSYNVPDEMTWLATEINKKLKLAA